ncbi:hypothetical protein CEXT_733611 [Caerostris extrusa]|uniref:Uncharacterized protein n=1 Tax=Caerostris extrusa TaxID=172846 RepID=A0AAV4U1K1_CAEEX|nr:hypothetical protein CEXT_733611 [Caerostris extrusa]
MPRSKCYNITFEDVFFETRLGYSHLKEPKFSSGIKTKCKAPLKYFYFSPSVFQFYLSFHFFLPKWSVFPCTIPTSIDHEENQSIMVRFDVWKGTEKKRRNSSHKSKVFPSSILRFISIYSHLWES